ncbi:immunity repressor [Ruegeria phage RpAliso]|nr:immunity repressor [Ruegeria phage RpAliso]
MAYTKEEWWKTDDAGRRIGWLYPEDMAVILESFYGSKRWVQLFSEQFGFSRSAVDRWKDGKTPIPKNVAQTINMMSTMKNRGIPMSDVEASWLPYGEGINSPKPPVEDPADAGE